MKQSVRILQSYALTLELKIKLHIEECYHNLNDVNSGYVNELKNEIAEIEADIKILECLKWNTWIDACGGGMIKSNNHAETFDALKTFYFSEIKKACKNIRPAVLSEQIGRGKCGLYNALKGKASVEKMKEIYEVIYEQKWICKTNFCGFG